MHFKDSNIVIFVSSRRITAGVLKLLHFVEPFELTVLLKEPLDEREAIGYKIS